MGFFECVMLRTPSSTLMPLPFALGYYPSGPNAPSCAERLHPSTGLRSLQPPLALPCLSYPSPLPRQACSMAVPSFSGSLELPRVSRQHKSLLGHVSPLPLPLFQAPPCGHPTSLGVPLLLHPWHNAIWCCFSPPLVRIHGLDCTPPLSQRPKPWTGLAPFQDANAFALAGASSPPTPPLYPSPPPTSPTNP